jgi:hypothetical protein
LDDAVPVARIDSCRVRVLRGLSAGVAVLCLLGILAAGGSAAGKPARLTQSQWASYVKTHNTYAKQTAKTVAVFRKCQSSTAYTSYLGAFAKCLGTAPAKEVAVTNALFNFLHGVQSKVGGACATATANYAGAAYFWKAAVVGIERAVKIKSSSVATVEGQTQNAQIAAQKVDADAAIFTRACKPLKKK